jgi:hypothetical protein
VKEKQKTTKKLGKICAPIGRTFTQLISQLSGGCCVTASRGDWTPLELFLASVHSLPADLICAAKALATIDPAHQDT